MTEITWNNSIRDFLEQAGSSQPTPGGGSVAALVAALGASMTAMVGHLSRGERFAHLQPQIDNVLAEMGRLSEACEQLLHEDIVAFDQYMAALKLPGETEEDKLKRRLALQEAAVNAVKVPLRLIEVCNEGMQLTHRIAESANRNVISDLGIGAILFDAAAQSANLTVEINLATLKDEELRRQYVEYAAHLIGEIERLKHEALAVSRSRM